MEGNDTNSENELLKEKVSLLLLQYFELRSTEDTLTSDLKRVKDRLQTENIMRTKFEEESKELGFRVIELEEIL